MRLPYDGELGDFHVPAELQIRSVFEDAWGEIDHKLFFEFDRRTGNDDDKVQREIISQHLGILKTMLDSAADYADVIKRTLISPANQPVIISRSMDGTKYLESLLKESKIPTSLSLDISALSAEKERIDSEIERGTELGGPLSYIKVADQLGELIEKKLSIITDSVDRKILEIRRSLRANLLLEEALCRLLSEDRQQIRLAVAQYESITKNYPDHPVGWFRYGQALSRIVLDAVPGSADAEETAKLASGAYEKAREALSSLDRNPPKIFPTIMSREQDVFIRDNLNKLHGFLIWRNSDLRRRSKRPSLDDVSDIEKAYKITTQGIVDPGEPESEIRLVNNAVYYAADGIRIKSELGLELGLTSSFPELEMLINRLDKYTGNKLGDDIERWDTIVHIKELLGDHVGAKEAAARVLDANSTVRADGVDTQSAYQREMRQRAVQNAWSVYRRDP